MGCAGSACTHRQGGNVTASLTTGAYGSGERRHPRLVRRTAWLRRHSVAVGVAAVVLIAAVFFLDAGVHPVSMAGFYLCLLYTSDAADDLLCVDLGGRRIIKKK